jgi:hypothetical protein
LSLKGYLKDIENRIKITEKEKENIIDNKLKELFNDYIDFAKLLCSNNLKFKWEISKDKLMDTLNLFSNKEYLI